MRYFTLVLLIISGISFTKAQQLTKDNLPSPGELHKFQIARAGNVAMGSTGENQVWDYTNIVDSFGSPYEYYLSASETPYTGDFPNANLANMPDTTGSAYGFYIKSDTGLAYRGKVEGFSSVKLTDPPLLFKRPFSYGDSFYDSTYNEITVAGKLVEVTWITRAEATGTGTLKMPGYEANNVVQVMYSSYRKDVYSSHDEIIEDTIYRYWSPESSQPLLTVQKLHTIGRYNTESQSKQVLYQEFFTSGLKPVTRQNNELLVYPNPASNWIQFHSKENAIERLVIYTPEGRVKSIEPVNTQTSLSINNWADGYYFYKAFMQDGTFLSGSFQISNH